MLETDSLAIGKLGDLLIDAVDDWHHACCHCEKDAVKRSLRGGLLSKHQMAWYAESPALGSFLRVCRHYLCQSFGSLD
jgi:hypothetical protein